MSDTTNIGPARRDFLVLGLSAAALAAVSPATFAALSSEPSFPINHGIMTLSTVTTRDGVEIFYKDWRPKSAQPIVLHHGWPLSGDE